MKLTKKQKQREYMKKYRLEHREEMIATIHRWKENNKERYFKNIYDWRKAKVNELREQGVSNAWGVVNYGEKAKYKIKEEN